MEPRGEDDERANVDETQLEQPETLSVGDGMIDSTQELVQTRRRRRDAAEDFAVLSAGQAIGRYVIVAEIGRGGMGCVYHAHDPELDRGVAIKLLRDQIDVPNRERGHTLLMREARAIAKVSHPNVIAVYDVGVHSGRIYVAMELVRGRPLGAWMRDAHELDEVLEIFTQAARGLASAHAAGLVHRDFKPANVLVGDDGRVRVLDFGLARVPGAGTLEALDESTFPDAPLLTTNLTIAGTLAGTPAYMSPEQFSLGEVDPASDQFAFFISLHEALFGVRPFVAESLWNLREAVLRDELLLPSAAKDLPAELLVLLRRGLSKRRDDRHPSMDRVADRLEAVRAALELDTTLTIPLGFLPRTVDATPTPSSSKHLTGYLSTLPRGLDSHPHCTMDVGTLRFVLARYPLDHLAEDTLSSQILATLEARAETNERWIPEVPARVLLAAVYERHVRSRAAWDELWAAIARLRFTRGFSSFTLPRNLDKFGPAFARVWAEYHRGTTLAFEDHDGALELRLSYPRGLLDSLGHAEVLQMARVGLEFAGHRRVEIASHDGDANQLRATLQVG